MLKMDLEYFKKILFIRLSGELKRNKVYKINNYIVPILKKHKIKYVIYNLKNLKSIDDSGVDSILNTKCIIKKNKGKVLLCEVNKEIINRLKRLKLKIAISEQGALEIIEV